MSTSRARKPRTTLRLALWCVACFLCVEAGMRVVYRAELGALAETIEERRGELGDEATARWAVVERNTVKERVRAWDLDVLRLAAEHSNRARYGDPVGPSYSQLRAAERTDADILDSATRSNSAVDTLMWLLLALGLGLGGGLALWAKRRRTRADVPWRTRRDVGEVAAAALFGWLAARGLGYILGVMLGVLGGVAAMMGATLGAGLGIAFSASMVVRARQRHAWTGGG